MTLADILIPPSLDARQAMRLQRLVFGALTYGLSAVLMGFACLFDMLRASDALAISVAFVAINAGLYIAIRSGFNLRLRDPSLTRVQILVAITLLMYIIYRMDDGRNIALFACFVIFMFGLFRLGAREYIFITLYTLAAYALVVNLLMHLRPQAILDVHKDWLSWLGLAIFLPCFSMLGEQVNRLRRRMRESEARFRNLTEMSSDFYWATDATHRLKERGKAGINAPRPTTFERGAKIKDLLTLGAAG